MKKSWKKWGILGILSVCLMAALAGCGGGEKEEETESVPEPLYPVTINGTEIRVGETTMQTLLDKGFRITVSEMTPDKQINEYEIDPEMDMEANSYYSGGSIWITDSTFMHIAIVTGEEEVKMGDAVVARMEINLSSDDQGNLQDIAFNGVPVAELNREKAGEMFPDFTGDENMWFSPAEMREYEYFMAFDAEGTMTKFSAEKEYDVDWSSGN